MAGNTGSPFNLRYPTSNDQVNVHGDIQNLATDVAAALNGVAFKNNSNTFAATNTFTVTSANPAISINITGGGAAISTTGKIVAGEFELSTGTSSQFLKGDGSVDSNSYSLSSHTHGNINNDGEIGSISGLMIKTGTDGVLETLAAGTSGQYLQYDGTWSTPPDTNTNTTYTFDTGTTNGTFTVTPLGESAQSISIYGLGSAAYTESSDYATSSHTHTGVYQPINTTLSNIADSTGLTTGSGFVKRNANNTYSLDTNSYLTANQSITLSGAIAGSGTTSIVTRMLNEGPTRNLSSGYTLVLDPLASPNDLSMHKTILLDPAGANATLTIPVSTDVNAPVGTQINIVQISAGVITIAGATSPSTVTVNFNGGSPTKNKLNGQWAGATLVKYGTNAWTVIGNLTS